MMIKKYSYKGIPVAGGRGFGLAPLAIAAISLGAKLIPTLGKLLGMKPRGEFQKFARNLYPYMRTAAAQSGLPVYCMWFGDWVGVNPDGSYGVAIGKEITASGYYPGRAEIETYQNGANPFYRTDGPKGSDIVNHPEQAFFELFDPMGIVNDMPEIIGGGGSPEGSSDIVKNAGSVIPLNSGVSSQSVFGGVPWLLLGGAGIVAYLIYGRKRG